MQTVTDLKICTLMCFCCRKYIMFAPKKYRGVMCHNDAKYEEELICALKNDVRNFANFDATLKIYTLMVFFRPKYIMFERKKYRGVMRHYTEDRCKL